MKKEVEIQSAHFSGWKGAIGSGDYFILEEEKYIYPKSVKIWLDRERIYPTSFDEHGNPRIDGIAGLLFIWKKRQMVMDGLIESQYTKLTAKCEYDIAPSYLKIPMEDRIIKFGICPVCNKQFSHIDLDGGVESEDNVLFHKDCLKEFHKLKMTDRISDNFYYGFMRSLKNELKWKKDVDWEVIANEYCNLKCCSHRPWFMFCTPYGKIKIGWRKRVINIDFMNFKDIDFNRLFKDEDTTKGGSDGNYGIHAWSYEKMYSYLKSVTEEIDKKNLV